MVDLDEIEPETDSDTEAQQQRGLTSYFLATAGVSNRLGINYYILKSIGTLLPIVNLGIASVLNGKHFLTYGYDLAWYWYDSRTSYPDPMDLIFPIMTKCKHSV